MCVYLVHFLYFIEIGFNFYGAKLAQLLYELSELIGPYIFIVGSYILGSRE